MLVENYSNSPGRHTYPVVVRIFIGLRANNSSSKSVHVAADWVKDVLIIFRSVRTRRGQPTLPYIPRRQMPSSAQLSCHDAPIFRLLLKIAVSLTAFNVTLSIFWWLTAATPPQATVRPTRAYKR